MTSGNSEEPELGVVTITLTPMDGSTVGGDE
jgi:hypothetical protein